ncbi:hypothetical protein [Amycolatopsis aidingensis]|uniref:hypothetical protein n=1 Tax=Amycolatopsis aidingensis TaxID=2842453 RepID=UPI001C0E16D3|nr:hypothetical protein [Amycolatopsis aidingensis]
MTGLAFYTRPQWLTDEHIAHSCMLQADGSRVDAVRVQRRTSRARTLAATSSIRSGTAVSPPRRTSFGSRRRCATARRWTRRRQPRQLGQLEHLPVHRPVLPSGGSVFKGWQGWVEQGASGSHTPVICRAA